MLRWPIIAAVVVLCAWFGAPARGQQILYNHWVQTTAPTVADGVIVGGVWYDTSTSASKVCDAVDATNCTSWTTMGGGGAGLPAGMIALTAGACPAAWSEYTAARGFAIVGVPASGTAAGTVGSALTNLQDKSVTPTFTGAALGTHSHAIGTYVAANESSHTHGGSTIAWPAGVPTHSGTAATFAGNALAGHAHELPWQIPSTTTIRQIAVAAFGTGTSRAATAVSAAGTANTTSAAVALSQSVGAGTPAGTVTISNQGTIAWPAGVPTNGTTGTGSAHTHALSGSSEAVGAGTPAGTVSSVTTSGVLPYIQLRACSKD